MAKKATEGTELQLQSHIQALLYIYNTDYMMSLITVHILHAPCISQVKCQAGYRRDPGNPTQDPRWEWRDPALGGGIPPFPPGMKI